MSEFSRRSRTIAGRFLQSAVIVDDQAYMGEHPRVLVSPGRGQRGGEQAGSVEQRPTTARHDLDARRLINSFAELGIVCAVLKPLLKAGVPANEADRDTMETLSGRIDEATKRADIVIMDWNLPDEEYPGQNARRLVNEILRADSTDVAGVSDDHSRRLRLVAIYTGDEDLEKITQEMGEMVTQMGAGDVEVGKYRVRAGAVTVVVYGKGGSVIRADDAVRRVDEGELPRRLQSDFAEVTEGLLSNTALAALSAIRTNTHRILNRFNRGVDAPYVAHRAMIEPPEEAEEHPVPLIASEIQGVLADDLRIPEGVGLDALKEWLAVRSLHDETISSELEMNVESFKEALLSLLEGGLEKAAKNKQHPKWNALVTDLRRYNRDAAGVITKALSPEETDAAKLDMEFARLTSLRSQYDSPPPVLRLGSIVTTLDKGKIVYLLCIQPLCDSVRLKRARRFPFLRLRERMARDANHFDLVVFDEGVHRKLAISSKAYEILILEMEPDRESGTVRAKEHGGRWLFPISGSGEPVRWLADLKPDFAQRAMNQFVSEVARVGLTESEWLRRMATRDRVSPRLVAEDDPGAASSGKS